MSFNTSIEHFINKSSLFNSKIFIENVFDSPVASPERNDTAMQLITPVRPATPESLPSITSSFIAASLASTTTIAITSQAQLASTTDETNSVEVPVSEPETKETNSGPEEPSESLQKQEPDESSKQEPDQLSIQEREQSSKQEPDIPVKHESEQTPIDQQEQVLENDSAADPNTEDEAMVLSTSASSL
jgi:hypothetical protein